jgi:hypothetical protein
MKYEEFEPYWKEVASKAGLDDEKAAAALELFKNDKVREAFVTRSSYSRDLDKVRDEAHKKGLDEGTTKSKAFYDKWWKEEGEPTHKKTLSILDEYNQLVSLYGKPDDPTKQKGNGDRTFTMEEVQKLLDEKLASTNSAYVDMLKKSMSVSSRHLHEFGEPLNPEELEKFATENGYSDINQAYQAYIAPRVTEREKAKHEEAVAKAREEGLKEGLSRSHAPTSGDRLYDNPFLRKPEGEVGKDAAKADFFSAFDESQ